METSAGEPLISTRPFAVTKQSAWLVSKESPVSQAPCLVILNPLQHLTAPPAVVTLQTAYKKNSGYKNPLFPILWEDKTNVQECLHMVKWGVQRVTSEPPQAPGYNNNNIYLLQLGCHPVAVVTLHVHKT